MPARAFASVLLCLGLLAVVVSCGEDRESVHSASTALSTTGLTFTNTPLLRPDGASEPAVSIRADGTMALTALSWQNFFTHA